MYRLIPLACKRKLKCEEYGHEWPREKAASSFPFFFYIGFFPHYNSCILSLLIAALGCLEIKKLSSFLLIIQRIAWGDQISPVKQSAISYRNSSSGSQCWKANQLCSSSPRVQFGNGAETCSWTFSILSQNAQAAIWAKTESFVLPSS